VPLCNGSREEACSSYITFSAVDLTAEKAFDRTDLNLINTNTNIANINVNIIQPRVALVFHQSLINENDTKAMNIAQNQKSSFNFLFIVCIYPSFSDLNIITYLFIH